MAMPVYSMTCFKLPMEICSEIDSLLSQFWWGTRNGKRKMAWSSWKKLSFSKKQGGMGFRDLHIFNQALLANQVWKLITRPNSLLFRVLKAKYFPKTNILNAGKGSRSSYGWQSLCFGRELLTEGLQKIIGDGYATSLTESWLPVIPPRGPRLLPYTNPSLPVSSLIDPITKQWSDTEIRDLIEMDDHHLINKIFLPPLPVSDSYIWPHTASGSYTVRSGYHYMKNRQTVDEHDRPVLASNEGLSQGIWSANVTPKLQHFLWRLTSNALPVRDLLRHRRIISNALCPRCSNDDESSLHLFFHCPFAQSVWRLAGIQLQAIHDPQIGLQDKITSILKLAADDKVNSDLRLLPIWILWRLWKNRNDYVFNCKDFSAHEVLSKASVDLQEWTTYQNQPVLQHPPVPTVRERRWNKPPRGWVKCNVDASHSTGNMSSGLGWILRDNLGNFLEAGSGKFQGRFSAQEAECTALIWALQSCWSMGYDSIEFEGDNQGIINLLLKPSINYKLQHYITTIKAWESMFTQINFQFSTRETNRAADVLAKFTLPSDQHFHLFHTCHNVLKQIVLDDI